MKTECYQFQQTQDLTHKQANAEVMYNLWDPIPTKFDKYVILLRLPFLISKIDLIPVSHALLLDIVVTHPSPQHVNPLCYATIKKIT
jgi:hypothetical protein